MVYGADINMSIEKPTSRVWPETISALYH
jgi:hypothetical protein